MACAKKLEHSMVYTLTPEVAFSPSLAKAFSTYRVGNILNSTETRNTEFKTGPYAIDNLEDTIRRYGSAFLNSGGGSLLFGILDNGIVAGVYIPSYKMMSIKRTIEKEFALFKPIVAGDKYDINFVQTDIRDKYVIELHVRGGETDQIYVGRDDKMYVRRDGSVQGPLWPRSIEEIVLDKLQKKSDNMKTANTLLKLS